MRRRNRSPSPWLWLPSLGPQSQPSHQQADHEPLASAFLSVSWEGLNTKVLFGTQLLKPFNTCPLLIPRRKAEMGQLREEGRTTPQSLSDLRGRTLHIPKSPPTFTLGALAHH